MIRMILNLNKYQEIIKKIQQLIKERNLGVGDRLPPERELASIFGVNRSSLREAVRILVAFRILESRVGSGVYVKDPDLDGSIEMLILQNDVGIEIKEDEMLDMLDIRAVLEMYAIRKICLRKSDADISELLSIIESPKDVEPGSEEHDRMFHLGLAKASGNKLLVRLLNTLYMINMNRRSIYFSDETRRKQSLEDHIELYKALDARNLKLAEAIMIDHIKRASQVYGIDYHLSSF